MFKKRLFYSRIISNHQVHLVLVMASNEAKAKQMIEKAGYKVFYMYEVNVKNGLAIL